LLLGGVFVLPAPAYSQTQPEQGGGGPATTENPPPGAVDETGEEEEIVVQGAKPRGSVIGDIPPEKTYDARDVRATGAANINELLDALAPEIGSARGRGGGAPVLLLNGQRISSFRELRDIPTEAIQRVEILPEEVALKYGYRADQRVVNIVLRQRFRSTTALASANVATDGGYLGGTGDVTRLLIQRNGRTTLNAHAEGNGMLTEAERNIRLSPDAPADDREFRSLIGTKRDIRGTATFNRTILGNVSATANAELEHSTGRSLIGLDETLLDPITRNSKTDSAHAGTALNWEKAKWHFNVTGNLDYDRSLTLTDSQDTAFSRNRARSISTAGDLTGTANGALFQLPAGNATTTLKLGVNHQHLDSESRSLDVETPSSLGRTTGQGAINLDLPISRRGRAFKALGNLTLNANAEVDQISDFGTLTTIGAGANFSPVDRLSFITSWTREEGAPTINQLGDPLLVTPGTRVFDFSRNETALVTATTGGNRDLTADRRNVWKLGGNWQPSSKLDLRLRADYVHQTIDNPTANVTITPTIEAAFPGRFTRGAPAPGETVGPLLAVDLRPINFDQSRRDTLRVGFDFSKPLKSRRPSQAVMDQLRNQLFGQRGGAQGAGGPPPGPRPEGSGGGRGFGGRGGGGGFFGGGGGGNRGRIQFSLTDTITFVDKVIIGPGLPEIDYLHGDATGSSGGTPRHQVQAQAGYFNNGLGARLGANWRSGTDVNSLNGDDLHFSSLATFDLRLFANPGDIPEMVVKHPWLRGTQVRFEVNNIFNSRPKVHDAAGVVPLNYQPDLLDPLGRTIMISFRKLFLPSPAFFRRQFQQRQQQQQGTTPGGGDE